MVLNHQPWHCANNQIWKVKQTCNVKKTDWLWNNQEFRKRNCQPPPLSWNKRVLHLSAQIHLLKITSLSTGMSSGSGGGFFLMCKDLGRMFDDSFPACAFLNSILKWRLARANWFHSLCQNQSTVAQWAETTVTECSLTSYVSAHFLIGSHTMPGQRHSQPTPT